MKFNSRYFLITLIILLIEVAIATVLQKISFVRAYLGDILVVILIYCFIRTFFPIKNKEKLLIGIFLFAVFVEILQYFKLATFFGMGKGTIGYILLGNYFSWEDILCYATGCFFALIGDKK